MCGACVWRMCVGACVWRMCVADVCDACVCGACVWCMCVWCMCVVLHVCGACVCGACVCGRMCVVHVCVVHLCRLCGCFDVWLGVSGAGSTLFVCVWCLTCTNQTLPPPPSTRLCNDCAAWDGCVDGGVWQRLGGLWTASACAAWAPRVRCRGNFAW